MLEGNKPPKRHCADHDYVFAVDESTITDSKEATSSTNAAAQVTPEGEMVSLETPSKPVPDPKDPPRPPSKTPSYQKETKGIFRASLDSFSPLGKQTTQTETPTLTPTLSFLLENENAARKWNESSVHTMLLPQVTRTTSLVSNCAQSKSRCKFIITCVSNMHTKCA
jgi:hypothetical protein